MQFQNRQPNILTSPGNKDAPEITPASILEAFFHFVHDRQNKMKLLMFEPRPRPLPDPGTVNGVGESEGTRVKRVQGGFSSRLVERYQRPSWSNNPPSLGSERFSGRCCHNRPNVKTQAKAVHLCSVHHPFIFQEHIQRAQPDPSVWSWNPPLVGVGPSWPDSGSSSRHRPKVRNVSWILCWNLISCRNHTTCVLTSCSFCLTMVFKDQQVTPAAPVHSWSQHKHYPSRAFQWKCCHTGQALRPQGKKGPASVQRDKMAEGDGGRSRSSERSVEQVYVCESSPSCVPVKPSPSLMCHRTASFRGEAFFTLPWSCE